MMNLRNLGSKERLVVKSVEDICAKFALCLKLWFESDLLFLEEVYRETLDNYKYQLLPTFFLNQKHNVGWFLLRKFADFLRVSSLHIISRNRSKHFFVD